MFTFDCGSSAITATIRQATTESVHWLLECLTSQLSEFMNLASCVNDHDGLQLIFTQQLDAAKEGLIWCVLPQSLLEPHLIGKETYAVFWISVEDAVLVTPLRA